MTNHETTLRTLFARAENMSYSRRSKFNGVRMSKLDKRRRENQVRSALLGR